MNISSVSSKFNYYGQSDCKKQLPQSPKLNTLKADTYSFTGIFDRFKKTKDLEELVPKHKGIVYEKIRDENGNVIKKVPVEVDIVKDTPKSFVFMRDQDIVGELKLEYVEGSWNGRMLRKNYRKHGVTGKRIEVNFVKNIAPEKYSGIAHLSDLIEVACCKEMGFKPTVVSYSINKVAPLHYLRGKRFIPFNEYNTYYSNYYEGCDPNEIVADIIKRTPKGEKFDTSEIKHSFLMYMPKEMIQELEEELKEHPIF